MIVLFVLLVLFFRGIVVIMYEYSIHMEVYIWVCFWVIVVARAA